MARKSSAKGAISTPKKTSIGHGSYRKYGNKGGGEGGSTKSKNYVKRYRGQGR
jgi:hypothetical protein